MPRRVQVINHSDFTGGLNLRRGQFLLKDNESPNLLNVDVDPRGGFRLRGGVQPYGPAATDADIHSLAQLHNPSVDQLVAGWGLKVGYSTGSSWTNIVTNQTVTTPFTATQFKNALYVQNGTDQPLKWTGSASSRMTQTYADDFSSPGSGKMPIGTCVASHMSHVFVAHTLESATTFPHRIRFSHPNMPESYRTNDFIDIDPGVDGDKIVALVPNGDHLVIVKTKSIHALFGAGWDSWSVQPISRDLGAGGVNAACSAPEGTYLFGYPHGLMLWTGRSLEWKFEPLKPYIDLGLIGEESLDEVNVGRLNGRIWVTIPFSTGAHGLFVYDPTVGKEGAWTVYAPHSPRVTLQWAPEADDHLPLFVQQASAYVAVGDQYDQAFDKFTPSSDEEHITSYYTTNWFDAGQPAIKKRWRRPQTVYYGEAPSTVRVSMSKDYNNGDERKTFFDAIGVNTGTAVFDDADSVFDGTDPDDLFATSDPSTYKITRGSPLGNAKAVQLRYHGPEDDIVWGVESVSLPFIPRKLR